MLNEVDWWWLELFVNVAHPRPAFRHDELVLFKITIQPPRWSIVGDKRNRQIKHPLGIYPVALTVVANCPLKGINKILSDCPLHAYKVMVHLKNMLYTLSNVLAQCAFNVSMLEEVSRQQLHRIIQMHALTLFDVDTVNHLKIKTSLAYSICSG